MIIWLKPHPVDLNSISGLLTIYRCYDGEWTVTLHRHPVRNGIDCGNVKREMKAEVLDNRLLRENIRQEEILSEDCPEIS